MSGFGKKFFVLLAVGVVSCMALPVFAQSPSDIKFTTNVELAVPGRVLEPGTYWLRRASSSEESIYRLSDDDGRLITFMQVIPADRKESDDTQVVVSSPDAAGVRLLQAWFSGGDTRGYEVVYSKSDLRKLDRIAEMRTGASGSAGQQ
jgi:hypothetical protein